MILLPILKRNGVVDVLIILEEENVVRLRQADPAEIIWSQLPPEYCNRRPGTIGIVIASPNETEHLTNLMHQGKTEEALQFAIRGFKFQPEAGDHDFGPVSIKNQKPS